MNHKVYASNTILTSYEDAFPAASASEAGPHGFKPSGLRSGLAGKLSVELTGAGISSFGTEPGLDRIDVGSGLEAVTRRKCVSALPCIEFTDTSDLVV